MQLPQNARVTWGAWLWVLSLQYYALQIITSLAWTKVGFSWAHNTISDLGNTACGVYGAQLVCSPWHAAMNGSFGLLGVTMIVGALLLLRSQPRRPAITIGYSFMMLSGVGTMLVGLFPENSISALHVLGAALAFVLGNFGVLLLGVSLPRLSKLLRAYTIALGLIGLAGLMLFVTHYYLGLGAGGMERAAAYPQSLWMMSYGVWLLLRRRRAPLASEI